uniref:hypothetical protein n=1 Tax=Amycolatopsis sp. CA-082387 TaxID=3239918 RepID=UPI003F4912C7
MNNSEDRVRRLDVAGAQSPTPGPLNPGSAPGRHRLRVDSAKPWSNVVNDGIHDDKVRRDVLIALGMVLIAVFAMVVALTGALGPLFGAAAGNGVVRVVAGSVLGGGGLIWGGFRLRRRRARHTEDATVPDEQQDEPDARQAN